MASLDLAAAAKRASAHAVTAGALQPLEIELATVTEGVPFEIRCLSSQALKHVAAMLSRESKPAGYNPFLPFEQDLFVADLSQTHLAILNKFPIEAGHLLIITRAFVDQEAPLDGTDFDALARLMAAVDSLVFYNSSVTAGASQPHRHLQLVPPRIYPCEPLFPSAGDGKPVRLSFLPFRHAFVHLNESHWSDTAGAADHLKAAFDFACGYCGLTVSNGKLAPYNLLVKRGWMLLVPRSRHHFEDSGQQIAVNALNFAGSVIVRDRAQMEIARTAGLIRILAAVTFPL
jgi:ATP adenylyltransferase